MNITINQISPQETYQVRLPVLRKGMSLEDCKFKGDELATTIHLGVFDDAIIVGVATFLLKNKIEISAVRPESNLMYQLRGMAILESHQKKGLGSKLIESAEQLLKIKGADVLWFHARTSAIPFYKKMGYLIVGEELQLEPAGPHFKMYREL